MSKLYLLGFALFLIGYSLFKYQAVPSLMGQPTYILSTAIRVVLTAILPFALTHMAVRGERTAMRVGLAASVPFLLCGAGLATYFYIFIKPSVPDLSVFAILPRAIMPALFISALLILREVLPSDAAQQPVGTA